MITLTVAQPLSISIATKYHRHMIEGNLLLLGLGVGRLEVKPTTESVSEAHTLFSRRLLVDTFSRDRRQTVTETLCKNTDPIHENGLVQLPFCRPSICYYALTIKIQHMIAIQISAPQQVPYPTATL